MNRPAPSARPPGGVNGTEELARALLSTVPDLMNMLLAHVRARRGAWQHITYQQYAVLNVIASTSKPSLAEIARRLHVTPPVVTRMVVALEDMDLIKRQVDTTDRRAIRLVPTAMGRRRARVLTESLLGAAREILDAIEPARRTELAATMETLRLLFPPETTERAAASADASHPPSRRSVRRAGNTRVR